MLFLYLLSSCLFVVLVAITVLLLKCKKREAVISERLRSSQSESDALHLKLEETLRSAAAETSAQQKIISGLNDEIARVRSEKEVLADRISRDKEELQKLQDSFRLEFRNMATEMLQQKGEQFKKLNEESLEILLRPFRHNIIEFRERVEKIYSEQNQQSGALRNELKNLFELNRRITDETSALTNALKGNSKVQGDWGETILQTILETSDLVKGIHYTVQENFTGEDGRNLRPDVVLNLPGDKKVIIDSKVSLTSYVNYTSCETEGERQSILQEHLRSVRSHVNELGNKNYHKLVDSDFVVMFIPNEPAFLCAMQNDGSIWSDAYRKKVIISSPTNLFALLKLVDDMWRRDDQNRNALEIAERGGRLYDKFVGFVETLEGLGKNITQAGAAYERAMGQLSKGSGNLVGQAEKLRALGAKTSKTLSEKIKLEESGEIL